MKKVLLYTIVFWVNISFAQYREWHVKSYTFTPPVFPATATNDNETNVSGDGMSLGTAWALQHALSNPSGVILPGDTVWLHGGTYVGRFTSSLQGDATNFITVASYPGEWAVLNGNKFKFQSPLLDDPVAAIAPCGSSGSLTSEPLPVVQQDIQFSPIDEGGDKNDIAQDVLTVNAGFTTYRDFEISFKGEFKRTRQLCNPPSPDAFALVHGIEHNATPEQSNNGTSKCKFVNLIIRNVPGHGTGSWKHTNDTEIYGCLIYNNGYVYRKDKVNGVCLSTYDVTGGGHGIYTQNASELTRIIKNNFVINNYDSGVVIWSGSETAHTTDFIKHYLFQDNIILNNGNPARKHFGYTINNVLTNDTSNSRDSKANLIIGSMSTTSFNHPTDIEVRDNWFYLNQRGSFISGILTNQTNDLRVHNNDFFKGTTCFVASTNSNYLSFNNNFYMGKRLQLAITPTDFLTNNWVFNNNNYYRFDPKLFQIFSADPLDLKTIEQFRADYYNNESSSTSNICSNQTGDITVAFHPIKNKIVQNVYNPNVFYVTLNNPVTSNNQTLATNRTVFFNNVANNYNIPNGRKITIRDAQNYFTELPTSPYIAASGINFPLNLTAFEQPLNFADMCTQHSLTEISTFIIEFSCDGINSDNLVHDVTETGTRTILAKRNIVLGTNYITNPSSNITAKSGKTIVLTANSHLKSSSTVLLKIEDPCPDIPYVIPPSARQSSPSSQDSNNIKETEKEFVLLYPNPTSGIFKVESLKELKIKHVEVYRINNANQVFAQKYNSEKTVSIDISNQPEGLYTVKIFFEDDSSITKTIIKK